MSASSKKKLRNSQDGSKLTERQVAEQKEAKKLKLYTAAFVTVLVVMVVVALAVGISLAMVGDVNIWAAVSLIGVTTFALSAAGVAVGNVFGSRYEKKAEMAGGIILILLGVKILLEHLGVL